jgi:type I restriction enzyme S subunit
VTAFARIPLRKLVSQVPTWNPSRPGNEDETFEYIDLSAIDQELKVINGARTVQCAEAPSRARQLVQEGDVLVSTVRPNLNGVAMVPPRLNCATASTGFCVIRAKRDVLDPRYAFHWVKSPVFVSSMMAQATGASYPAVSDRTVLDSEIPLPPLPEQRRIAAILDKADALRTRRREALAQLDRLAQSIFLEMFGDPVANPMRWPIVSVAELLKDAEVFVDGDWVESKDQDPDGEVRLIQLADVGDGVYLNKSARFMNKWTAIRLKCTSLTKGDVLIARMPDPLGRACMFPGDAKECVTVVDVCIARPSVGGPDPAWLMCCINTQSFRNQIAGEATGTTRTRISRGNLSKLAIIAPPLEMQREFARRYEAVLEQRAQMRSAEHKMKNLFNALQSCAFNEGL